HVVANSYEAAVTEVQLGDRTWQARSQDWATASASGDPLTVFVSIGP
ncbi:MAG TPA: hypothetical protein GX013_12100, partial [Propionibacterium sp.]|nr:hypothetical protein [Propionibacterium sp.]